ncbi:BCAR1 isoform 22 [Pongo abelii]|uniref:BCAR1 isoform 22 n=1 Tax=Pongo abelii TaxID=9601 RepID=A0A2J8VWG8_PONAB|nr:BCAR1 isoform 8 [Pongo abelii]PNJ61877.1 BCAR1 isoform 22 [Pongo abelii]
MPTKPFLSSALLSWKVLDFSDPGCQGTGQRRSCGHWAEGQGGPPGLAGGPVSQGSSN